LSLIVDLSGRRRGVAVRAAPNTNVPYPSTAIPTLWSEVGADIHWLGCAVAGDPGWSEQALPGLPRIALLSNELSVADCDGRVLFRQLLS
ncbi:MAG: hypothetical protein ABIH03_00610, partial [Pseudomonadota bacterium]